MDCEKAGEYMMKYMDGNLSESDAVKLNLHISECETCKLDFIIYDDLMRNFTEMPIVETPAGFVDKVMARVRELPAVQAYNNSSPDNALYVFWGVFSVLIGLGAILSMNKDSILAWMIQYPQFKPIADFIVPLSETVTSLSNSMIANARRLTAQAGELMSGLRYILLTVFGLVTAIQLFFFRKGADKGKVEG